MTASTATLLDVYRHLAGRYFGTEDQSLLLYALARMQRPAKVVELGTGLGATTFALALALRENGAGHLWSVDDGRAWRTILDRARGAGAERDLVESLAREPVVAPFFDAATRTRDVSHALSGLARAFGVDAHVTFVRATFDPHSPDVLDGAPWPEAAAGDLDVVVADAYHGVPRALAVVRAFLPRMASSSSIFVDSAATYLPTYMVLKETVRDLETGKVPVALVAGLSAEQRERVGVLARTRRIQLVPLVERKARAQNGLLWLRIEPVDFLPHPATETRGFACMPSPDPRPERVLGRAGDAS